MIVRWWRRGIVLSSLVSVVMAMMALFPDFIVWSRTFQHNDQQVGFISVPLRLPSSDGFGNASQHNSERKQDNPEMSSEYLLIQHSNETDLYASNNSVDDNSSVKAVQVRRRRRMDDACRRLNAANWTTSKLKEMAGRSDTLFVDDRLRYIYCLVPKVACTTWTRVLLITSGKVRQKDPNDISQNEVNFYRYQGRKLRPLARYDTASIDYRLRNYFKFMFVRHPLERLVSAFRDRLHGDHANARRALSAEILTHLASRKPANQSTSTRRQGGGVTFNEFVRYVVDLVNVPAGANQHWRPHYDLCHPCHIHYDFIGHYDTLRRDAEVVLTTIGAADRVQFPTTDRDNRRRHRMASELLSEMYADIPAEHVQLLKTRVYGNDFMLFDFN